VTVSCLAIIDFVEVGSMSSQLVDRPRYHEAANLDRVAFWLNLPGTSELSKAAQRHVRESEHNIRSERHECALDAAIALNAEAPGYLPGFVRTAELLVATRRRDTARQLLETIMRRERIAERNDFELELSKIRVHVERNPDLTRKLAHTIVQCRDTALTVPYVPAALEQLNANERFTDSVELAQEWVKNEPSSPLALSYLIRALLYANEAAAALSALRKFRDGYDADRIWPENIVASALATIASDDIEPKWMAAGPVCHDLRQGTIDYERVKDLLEFLVPAVDSSQRALIFAGLLAVNAGDYEESEALFRTTPAQTPVESFLRSVGMERCTSNAGDQHNRFAALKEIWRSLAEPQVASIARESDVFDPPATRTNVGLAIARMLQANEAYSDALKFLNDLNRTGYSDPEIVRLQAEILEQSGSGTAALQTLEELLRRQESSHQYADAIVTLEAMIVMSPGNTRLRGRVVENCLKVGKFEQAIDQLVTQGRLFHKSGRLTEAEAPIHRAIEIVTMTSDWEQVTKLHRLLISFAPEETRLRHAAVATYVQYGRTTDAIDQLREIVRIAREHSNLDEAIAASHQMLALDPNDPAAYHQLGELLVLIQEYNQADRVYRRLANLVPDDHAVKAKRSAIAALTRSRQASS
jgi:tetratricopeptide (TPR) repeat protein